MLRTGWAPAAVGVAVLGLTFALTADATAALAAGIGLLIWAAGGHVIVSTRSLPRMCLANMRQGAIHR